MVRFIFLVETLLVSSFLANGQRSTDFQTWNGLEVNYKISKKFRFHIDGQSRISLTDKSKNRYLGDFSIEWKPNKYFDFSLGYRSVYRKEINTSNGRIYTDLSFKLKPKESKLRISNRTRLQLDYVYNASNKEAAFRNKTSIGYNLSKLFDPTVSHEFFYSKEMFSDMRTKLGGSWRLKKDLHLSTYYAFETQLGRKTNNQRHLLMCKLSLDI